MSSCSARHISTFFFIGYTNKTVLRCTIWSATRTMWSCGASPQASPSFRTRTIPAGSTNSPCGSSACQARTTCPSSWRARHCCASALWMRDRAFASSGSCARLTTRAGRATGSSSPCSPRASSRATARTLTASCSRARCAKSPCCGTRRSAQHLRCHSGSQPPLRARGLLTLHRLGTDRRADRGHGRRRAIGA